MPNLSKKSHFYKLRPQKNTWFNRIFDLFQCIPAAIMFKEEDNRHSQVTGSKMKNVVICSINQLLG